METGLEARPRGNERFLLSIFGGAVVAAGALFALGLARKDREPAIATPAPPVEPVRVTAPAVAALLPVVVPFAVPPAPIEPSASAAPPLRAEGRLIKARWVSGEKAQRRRRARHRGERPRGLPSDLTLNPF